MAIGVCTWFPSVILGCLLDSVGPNIGGMIIYSYIIYLKFDIGYLYLLMVSLFAYGISFPPYHPGNNCILLIFWL